VIERLRSPKALGDSFGVVVEVEDDIVGGLVEMAVNGGGQRILDQR
jgi:hypothetical protein